jgi:hypothetical protein
MSPSIPSFLLSRSLSTAPTPRPVAPSPYEHINIGSVDTPTHALRSEILIGFQPIAPHPLVTLSKPTSTSSPSSIESACEIGLWDFQPGRAVKLIQRLRVADGSEYLPVVIAWTGFCQVREAYYQVLYRGSWNVGEGCIEVRCLPLHPGKAVGAWSVSQSVTEEDSVSKGTSWSLASSTTMHCGFIVVGTGSRVYFFFMEEHEPIAEVEGERYEWWTVDDRCIIFEVDLFMQQTGLRDFHNVEYATKVLGSEDGGKSISLHILIVNKRGLQIFKLRIFPEDLRVDVTEVSKPKTVDGRLGMKEWNAAKAMSSYALGLRLGMSCPNDRGKEYTPDTFTVFHPYVHGTERCTVDKLVWQYGGIVVHCWDR